MQIKNIKAQDSKQITELAELHKNTLKYTIATSLSIKQLSNLYKFLIENNYLKVIATTNEKEIIIGALTYRFRKNNIKFFDLLKIIKITVFGLLRHPFVWLIETFYKLGIYQGTNEEINILTLFVSEEFQGLGVGKNMINFLKKDFVSNISVDTRVENKRAVNFYLNNGFCIVNKNKKNIVLMIN